MGLTRLFVRRPTLVTVFVALVTIGGTLAAVGLVKQQFPNYDVPTIQVLLQNPGASTTEIRDAIVRPLEDQIAGAPDLANDRNGDPARPGHDRRALFAGFRRQHRSRAGAGARPKRAATTAERSGNPDDFDLRPRSGGDRIADRELHVACARRPLAARRQQDRARRSSRFKACRSSRRTAR